MKILGIDPGIATTGFGVIEDSPKGKYQLIDFGLITTDKKTPHGKRLDQIYSELSNHF